jgi:cytosine permease
MSDPTASTASPPSPAPAPVAGPTPVLERRPWQAGSAPQYIALFLWVVAFDQLPRATLAKGGLLPSVFGALAAGVLCYLMLYAPPALWGCRTGKTATSLGASTFGVAGAPWLLGVLMGVVQVVWFAVATFYATELTFEGLVSCGLMHHRWLEPLHLGQLLLPNPLFLVTSLAWSFAAAMVGHYLLQIISALMNVYPVFMAFALAGAVSATLADLPRFQSPAAGVPFQAAALPAFTMMIELVFGFFATAGAHAADWGAVSRTERDVRLGGWVGVVLASWTVTTLGLLTVAGAQSRLAAVGTVLPDHVAVQLDDSFRGAVLFGIGGTLGATILLVFGLGSLAPTCYSAYRFGHLFHAAWPRLSRLRWTVIGTTAAWLLIVTGRAGPLTTIFALAGAIVAPLVAALAADSFRQRGGWGGSRRGVNAPGVFAWAVGVATGLVPIVAEATGWDAGTRFQPAVVFAYVAAFLTYLALAALGLEAPAESAAADA